MNRCVGVVFLFVFYNPMVLSSPGEDIHSSCDSPSGTCGSVLVQRSHKISKNLGTDMDSKKAHCVRNTDCAPPEPICQQNHRCGSRRVVEPISTLPETLYDRALGWYQNWPPGDTNHRTWTKWVRSALPVIGTNETEDAALFEVAYFIENVFIQEDGSFDGAPGLYEKLVETKSTVFAVWGHCPSAWIHPAVQSTTGKRMSSGGASPDNVMVSEDWVLQYPRTCSARDTDCRDVSPEHRCNNCESGCEETMAHEFGHTIHIGTNKHFPQWNIQKKFEETFADWNNSWGGEIPAWKAQDWWHNRRKNPGSEDYNWFHGVLGFNHSNPWRYVTKDKRCPAKGITEPCDDAAHRTISVLPDAWSSSTPSVFSASSFNDAANAGCDPKFAFISEKCSKDVMWPSWCPKEANSAQWLQVDFGTGPSVITAVEVQGKYGGANWGNVKSLRVMCSNERHATDTSTWTTLASSLPGAWHQGCTGVRKSSINNLEACRSVRVYPLTWRHWPSMHIELYGCSLEVQQCTAPVMPMLGGLAASSFKDDNTMCEPIHAIMNKKCNQETPNWPSWCPAQASDQEWLQIDLGQAIKRITKVTIEGKYGGSNWGWVKKVRMMCSSKLHPTGDSDWTTVDENLPGAMHQGCSGARTTTLAAPVECRSVRFYPVEWVRWPSMAVQLHGCATDGSDCSNKLIEPHYDEESFAA